MNWKSTNKVAQKHCQNANAPLFQIFNVPFSFLRPLALQIIQLGTSLYFSLALQMKLPLFFGEQCPRTPLSLSL